MPFAQENGYIPLTVEQIVDEFRVYINTQFGTSYTTETFVGTNWYKNYYAIAQRQAENETKTAEIFSKYQDYIDFTNERISRPVATSPGLIEKLESEEYVASLKPIIEADAGKIHVCVDTDETDDDYAATKLDICTIIKDSTAAGCVTIGTESESIVLSNGQSFDFKFNLPNRIPVGLRLTITLSENNQNVIDDPDVVKSRLISNIESDYRLGKNFAPQRYFGIEDAPWASNVLLEYTEDVTDGEIDDTPAWESAVYDAEYDDLFEIALERIILVEN